MRQGHASRTAEFMALFRALESSLPETTRLFDDPFARTFLTFPLTIVAQLAGLPGLGRVLPWIIDDRVPGARSSAVARTRFIDDAIAASLGEHTEQLVILGAGFDSRAYRLPGLRAIRVFEVDHPDTFTTKRRVLERSSVLPEHVCFVPTDFNERKLESVMAAAGYRESARTFFLWEGVTNYLTEAAVDTTLRWCSRAAPGSQLLFTYIHRDVLTRPDAFIGTEKLFASLAKYGEKWTFGIEPSTLPTFLAERGLSLETDLGAAEYRALYYLDAAREMRGYEFYRIAVARVAERAAQQEAAHPKPVQIEAMSDAFVLYEGLLWEPPNGYFLLEYHLQRLQRSASHFHFALDLAAVRERLSAYARQLPRQPRKVRLELAANGAIALRDENVKPSTPVVVALAAEPIDSHDEFLRHKSTRRAVFDRALAAHPEAQDVLLWNERRELTETCHANVVLEIGGRRLTPPLSSGLQPGVFRAYLLDCGEIHEEILPVDSIKEASKIYLINSVRRWCELHLLDH